MRLTPNQWMQRDDAWVAAGYPADRWTFYERWNADLRRQRRAKAWDQYVRRLEQARAFKQMARELMDQHGLQNWEVGDLAELSCGEPRENSHWRDEWAHCFWATPESEKDGVHSGLWFWAENLSRKSKRFQREVILHEIAHALLPQDNVGHDETWAATAERIGVSRVAVVYDLIVAEHAAYRARHRRSGNQIKAARLKRAKTLSESQGAALYRRLINGD